MAGRQRGWKDKRTSGGTIKKEMHDENGTEVVVSKMFDVKQWNPGLQSNPGHMRNKNLVKNMISGGIIILPMSEKQRQISKL